MFKTTDGQTLQYPIEEIKAVVDNKIKRIKTNTGETFKAYIITENNDVAVFITPEGQILQYPTTALKSTNERTTENNGQNTQNNPLGLQLALKSAMSFSSNSFCGEGNIVIGHRNILQQRFFLGIGTGFIVNSIKEQSTLLPLFLRVEYHPLHQNKWSPFIGWDGGYMFQISPQKQGGPMTEWSVGARLNFGKKHNALQLSVYYKLYQENKSITESIDGQTFTRNGHTTSAHLGARIAVLL